MKSHARVQCHGSRRRDQREVQRTFKTCKWLPCTLACFALILLKGTTPSPRELQRPADKQPTETHIYRSNLLDVTSMWGMGVDARRRLKRRAEVPLVTWSAAASDMLEKAWFENQNPPLCRRALYMYPWNWGLASQMRDYSDAAIVSLAAGRTLVYARHASTTKWCASDAWIECYFQPLGGDICRRKQSEMSKIPKFDTWNANSRFKHHETAARLFGDAPAVHVVEGTRFDFVVDRPDFFPHAHWERMLENNNVRVLDRFHNSVNMSELKIKQPELYHTLSLSAFRTMLTPIIFAPKPDIAASAHARTNEIKLLPNQRCVALHVRWTDKRKDRGVSASMSHTIDHIPAALGRLEHLTGRSYTCLLLLSDDEVAAGNALMSKLGHAYEIKAVSRLHKIFESKAEYNVYRKTGHTYFEREVAKRDPERSYAYSRAVVIDILAASSAADYLLGVGSSGVSQILAQYMGAQRNVDANALAVWQEDVFIV